MDLPSRKRRRILARAHAQRYDELQVELRLRDTMGARLRALRARLPGSAQQWVLAIARLPAWGIVLAMIAYVLHPIWQVKDTIGQHDWDQMETHRELVRKTILDFHQFPFWQPYACGGHPNWGGFESGTTVVSPWLPFYLWMTLPHAMRVEILGSALISALGAWLLAGRFTRSPALKALVVVAFAVNGRWTLQIATGHTWHLAYAWTPWTLYFFDRVVGSDPTRGIPRLRDTVLMAVSVAMMVYTGGIYPLPETIFVVATYGVLLAAMTRSAQPLVSGLLGGLLGLGLAAPKLLPVLEVMFKHPRLVDSTETIDLNGLVDVLTSHDQDVTSYHAGISQWGWHEWGMYVGWAVVVAVLVGAVLARGPRDSALRWTGVLVFALGLGAFHAYAPWPLLHHVPVFKSQHVPSRWMYPAILVLAITAAAVAERGLRRAAWARGWLEIALLAAVAWTANDVAHVVRQPITHMFLTPMPAIPDSTGPFHTEVHASGPIAYQSEWAAPSLGAVMANVGTTDCGTFPAYHNYFRDHQGHIPGLGAHGVGDADYKGEAFLAEGTGKAEIVKFSPNEITVATHGATPGEHVVLNQNWDPGWSVANVKGTKTEEWKDTVSAIVSSPEQTLVFRYRPLAWWPGLGVFVGSVGAIVWSWRRRRRTG
jgi:hypothetical protein